LANFWLKQIKAKYKEYRGIQKISISPRSMNTYL
jgi:hypothetical protein